MFGLIPWRKERHTELSPVRRESDPFTLMRREFDSLFDRMFAAWPGLENGPERWGLDIEEKEGEALVRVEAPGFEASDFEVNVTGDTLLVRAERREEKKEGEEAAPAFRRERFERWVSLPPGTDAEKVEARYRNGVLEVRLPRTPEALGRRIEVKT